MNKNMMVVGLAFAAACTSSQSSPPSEARSVAADQSRQNLVMRGRAVVLASACGDCHGGFDNVSAPGFLAGVTRPDMEFPMGPDMIARPRNLTPDSTGTGPYTERQIFNALRYGLRPSTTPDVTITSMTPGQGNHPAEPDYLAPSMPWAAWRHMSDQELWAIAAYLKNGLKPVRNVVKPTDAPPDKWKEFVLSGRSGPYPPAAYPTANETGDMSPEVVRGRQLVIQKDCGGCHVGGPNPAAPGYLAGIRDSTGEFPIEGFKTRPRNITPDNETGMGRFTERQIFNSLRYGLRPGETADVEITSTVPGQGNHPARPKYLAPPMPWPSWRHLSDEDLRAIAAYLKKGLKPVSNRVQDSEGPPDFWLAFYTTADRFGKHPPVAYPTANEVGGR